MFVATAQVFARWTLVRFEIGRGKPDLVVFGHQGDPAGNAGEF
jgi:hypothetical protein